MAFDATKTHLLHDLVHNSPLIACRFDPTGRYVFAAAQDYRVWRWDLKSKDKQKVEFNTDAWVRGIAFDKAGQTMLTSGFDGRLTWWPATAEKPEPVRSIDAHQGWARAVAVSPDDQLVATVGNDLLVKLWNAKDGSLVREMSGHEWHIYNVAFHPNGTDLVTGDLRCHLIHWEVATGKNVRTWQAKSLYKYDPTFRADIGGFRGMTFSIRGTSLAVSGITNVTNAFAGIGNPSIPVFDWSTAKQRVEHLSKGKVRGVAWGVAIHPNGTVIGAAGGSGGFLLFWNPGDKDEFHQFKLPNNARDLHLSPNGLDVATAHHDGHVRISRMEAKAS